jgi:hypothetical protein
MLGEYLDVVGWGECFHDAIDRLNGTHGVVHEDGNIFFHEYKFWRAAASPALAAVSTSVRPSFLNAEHILPLFFPSLAGGPLLGLTVNTQRACDQRITI